MSFALGLRGGAATCLGAVLVLAPAAARAEPVRAGDEAVARTLFDEAKELVKAGRVADACPKLEEATRLEPEWIGALLWLGDCYERIGHLASAWTTYERITGLACAKPGRAKECDTARRQVEALGPRRSKLVVGVPKEVGDLPGVTVERDGMPAGRAQWNLPLPLDAGKHRLRVTAPGKVPWETEVDVPADGSERRVDVPLLQDVPPAPAPPLPSPPPTPPPPAEPPPPVRVPVWAWVTGAAGLALVGTSAGFLIDERNAQAAIDQHCGPTVCDMNNGFQVKDENARLWRSYGLFVGLGAGGLVAVGAAGYGIGAALRARPPASPRAGFRLRPDAWVAPGAAWGGVRGQF